MTHHPQRGRLVFHLAQQRGEGRVTLLFVLDAGEPADAFQILGGLVHPAVAQQRQRHRLPGLIAVRGERLPALGHFQGGRAVFHQQRQHGRALGDLGVFGGRRRLTVVGQRNIELVALPGQFRRQDLVGQLRARARLQRRSDFVFRRRRFRRLRVHHGGATAQQQQNAKTENL